MLIMKNQATYIRRELTSNLLKLFFDGRLEEEIDHIPVKKYPKDKTNIRCCIYKDRAITKYRIMAILGISIENETDETLSLAYYLKKALERDKVEEPVLTVIDAGCSSCITTNYYVTDMCKGCVARPCNVNCPKDAIIFKNDHAVIDKDKCVNCGICKKVCPYNAIVYIPVPCEEQCPVDAIQKDENGKEFIDYSKCIYCGRCTRSCPFGAIMERSQVFDIAKHIKNKTQVIAMLAPSVIGQFSGNINKVISGLKQVGFDKVFEVAVGADKTAKNEAIEFIEKIEKGEPMMGTSCCPAYVEAVNKHAEDFKPFVSHTKTPMSYTAEIINNDYPDAVKVFIGPCIAKKFEGIYDNNIDYALTFEELAAFFIAKDIDVQEYSEKDFDGTDATKFGKGFPKSNGVSEAVAHYVDGKVEVVPVLIDGLSKKGINTLKAYSKSKAPGNLIEVMSCEGGCICGPGIISNPKITEKKLKTYMDKS